MGTSAHGQPAQSGKDNSMSFAPRSLARSTLVASHMDDSFAYKSQQGVEIARDTFVMRDMEYKGEV